MRREGETTGLDFSLKVPCSYQVSAIGKYAFERIWTNSFVGWIIKNSRSNHLGAQGTFDSPPVYFLTPDRPGLGRGILVKVTKLKETGAGWRMRESGSE